MVARYQAAVLSGIAFKPHRDGPQEILSQVARVAWSRGGDMVRDCSSCQANRCKSPLKVSNPWIWPTRLWQRIHVDFAGPFNGGMGR